MKGRGGGGGGIVPGGCTPERAAKHQGPALCDGHRRCVCLRQPWSLTASRLSVHLPLRPRVLVCLRRPQRRVERRRVATPKDAQTGWPVWGQSLSAGGGAEGPEAGSHYMG